MGGTSSSGLSTQKTPTKEILKAKELMKKYFE